MSDQSKYLTLTDKSFQSEVLDSKDTVLVDFWAEWCGPCHIVAPVIEELAQEFEGRAKIGKLNVDKNSVTAANYQIQSIPTLLIFRNGEVVDKIIGAHPKAVLSEKLSAVLNAKEAEALKS